MEVPMSRLGQTSLEPLEPYDGKLSSTVLRGESPRKGADLLDVPPNSGKLHPITNNSTMNKTVQSIVSLTAFSALLIVITLFCGGLGFGRLFRIYGIMEYCFLGLLIITDVTVIYKVYKLYAMHPKVIMLLLGLECCSVVLWLAFICIDQSLLDWQITNFILQAVNLDGFTGDEGGLNMLAVLCGIIYPLLGIGCLFTGLRFINKLVTTKDSI